MSGEDYTAAKLDAFIAALDKLIAELRAAGVRETGLRRTLLARAVYEFIPDPADGIAAMDHLRTALVRELGQVKAHGSVQ